MENLSVENLLYKTYRKQIWHEEPVFCFTSDIDWASEDVMAKYFEKVDEYDIKPTLFVTHNSELIRKAFIENRIDRGIHPNFLNNSSHGDSFQEVMETCISFAPESMGFRSHRLFDVTDITHGLKEKYGFKYVSNLGTILYPDITPIVHESGLVHIPIFFEDGTHLYNKLDLDFMKYENYFRSPGIKVISFHPMNFIFNSPSMKFMRNIKDTLSREEYNNITLDTIRENKNNESGIGNTIEDIVNFVKRANYKIFSMNEIYSQIISS